jgi:hypothetical protein
MLRAITGWTPTEFQLALLKVMQDNGYDMTITAACEQAGICRETYYQYLRTSYFREWWQASADEYFARELPKVYSTMLARATGKSDAGSSQDAKLILERFDERYQPKSRADIDQRSTGELRIVVEHVDMPALTADNDVDALDVDAEAPALPAPDDDLGAPQPAEDAVQAPESDDQHLDDSQADAPANERKTGENANCEQNGPSTMPQDQRSPADPTQSTAKTSTKADQNDLRTSQVPPYKPF